MIPSQVLTHKGLTFVALLEHVEIIKNHIKTFFEPVGVVLSYARAASNGVDRMNLYRTINCIRLHYH